MIRKIRFIPSSTYVYENLLPPQPARNFVPNWWKEGELSVIQTSEGIRVAKNGDKNAKGGMKSCVPFLDAMISGYMICTWESIEILKNDSDSLEWQYVNKNPYTGKWEKNENVRVSMIDERIGDLGHTIPRPAGHSHNHMVLKGVWGIRTPRKWSLMLTHPYNRFDLPFTTVAGFMDSDEWWTQGNIPFFFKEGWTGVIPEGTPIAQIIPIKRSSWASYKSLYSTYRSKDLAKEARSVPQGWYKKNIWVKKQYE